MTVLCRRKQESRAIVSRISLAARHQQTCPRKTALARHPHRRADIALALKSIPLEARTFSVCQSVSKAVDFHCFRMCLRDISGREVLSEREDERQMTSVRCGIQTRHPVAFEARVHLVAMFAIAVRYCRPSTALPCLIRYVSRAEIGEDAVLTSKNPELPNFGNSPPFIDSSPQVGDVQAENR